MRENWLDDGLNEMFHDYDSEMNLEAEWLALQERRRQTRRPLVLWLLLSGLVVAGTSWYLYSTTLPTEIPLTPDTIIAVIDHTTEYVEKASTKFQIQPKIESETLNSIAIQEANKTTETNSNDSQQSQRLADWSIVSKQVQTPPITQRQSGSPNNTQPIPQDNAVNLAATSLSIQQIAKISRRPSLIKIENRVLGPLVVQQSIKRNKQSKAGNQYLGLSLSYSPMTSGTILTNEEASDGINASLYYKRYLSPGLFLATGINVDQYKTEVNGSSQNNYTQIENNQLIERHLYADGTIGDVYGNGEVQVIETLTYKLYNRYKFVSFPVIIGVQFYNSEQSHIELEGGVSTTLISQYEVKYFDGGISEFKKHENLALKQSGLFSGIASAAWYYQPRSLDRLNLFCKLGISVQLNDITSDQELKTEKFRSVAVGFGAAYRL